VQEFLVVSAVAARREFISEKTLLRGTDQILRFGIAHDRRHQNEDPTIWNFRFDDVSYSDIVAGMAGVSPGDIASLGSYLDVSLIPGMVVRTPEPGAGAAIYICSQLGRDGTRIGIMVPIVKHDHEIALRQSYDDHILNRTHIYVSSAVPAIIDGSVSFQAVKRFTERLRHPPYEIALGKGDWLYIVGYQTQNSTQDRVVLLGYDWVSASKGGHFEWTEVIRARNPVHTMLRSEDGGAEVMQEIIRYMDGTTLRKKIS
jgi:hypothetical protein